VSPTRKAQAISLISVRSCRLQRIFWRLRPSALKPPIPTQRLHLPPSSIAKTFCVISMPGTALRHSIFASGRVHPHAAPGRPWSLCGMATDRGRLRFAGNVFLQSQVDQTYLLQSMLSAEIPNIISAPSFSFLGSSCQSPPTNAAYSGPRVFSIVLIFWSNSSASLRSLFS
jgi:hypothetical protein